MLVNDVQVADGAASEAESADGTETAFNIAMLMFAGYLVFARLLPDLRYVRYILPAAFCVLWLARSAGRPRLALNLHVPLHPIAVATMLACVTSAVVVAAGGGFYSRFFEETLFLITPLAAALLCLSFRRAQGDAVFVGILLLLAADYVAEIGPAAIWQGLMNPALLLVDLAESVSPTESVHAFSFGVLGIYLLGRRRFVSGALGVLLAVLGAKRIVLAGLIVAVPAVLVFRRPLSRRSHVVLTIAAVAVNTCVALALLNLDAWGITDIVQDMTGQSPDAVTMGRVRLFGIVTDRLGGPSVVGAGLGRITDLLSTEGAWLSNPHSDILKNYLELGPIVFIVWIGAFYWASPSSVGLALALFLNALFLTDNVSIYFDVMFLFYLCLAHGSAGRTTAAAGSLPAPRGLYRPAVLHAGGHALAVPRAG